MEPLWSWDLERIAHREAKQQLARRLALEAQDGQTIGTGSGSSAYLALVALAERIHRQELQGVRFVPSSLEVQWNLESLGLDWLPLGGAQLDWLFDGADAADPHGNLIKGRGGALLREKQLFRATPDRRVLIDPSKQVAQLDERIPLPVEVQPAQVRAARAGLLDLGAQQVSVRSGSGKDGPVLTESGNLLLDCRFPVIGAELEAALAELPGVADSGLFWGYQPRLLTV